MSHTTTTAEIIFPAGFSYVGSFDTTVVWYPPGVLPGVDLGLSWSTDRVIVDF